MEEELVDGMDKVMDGEETNNGLGMRHSLWAGECSAIATVPPYIKPLCK